MVWLNLESENLQSEKWEVVSYKTFNLFTMSLDFVGDFSLDSLFALNGETKRCSVSNLSKVLRLLMGLAGVLTTEFLLILNSSASLLLR